MDKKEYHPAKTDMKWMNLGGNKNQAINRLIDANLDRAREGLRVIEDWCRFGLNQKQVVVTLKDWRQQLGTHHHEIYKRARDTKSDQGIGLEHPAQKNRHSPEQVVAANFSRVQEALRVLEEFSRNSDPELANSASRIRYGLYELESKVMQTILHTKLLQKLQNCNLCLITTPHSNLSTTIEESLKAGVKMVQYRSKKESDLEKFEQAKELAYLCKKYDALFIINDHLDLAIAVEADGIHLGQSDLPTKVVRNILGEQKLIGRSTHCLEQLHTAEYEGCDYFGVGPIFPTKTKPDQKPVGIDYVKEASLAAKRPWFAIGGINASNIEEVVAAGAERVALIGAVMNSNDPAAIILELQSKLP